MHKMIYKIFVQVQCCSRNRHLGCHVYNYQTFCTTKNGWLYDVSFHMYFVGSSCALPFPHAAAAALPHPLCF